MIVTKEDAKKLWCPMVNASVSVKDSMLISNRSITSRYCIADDCMMWVWSAEEYVNEQGNVPKGSCGLVQKYH
jgi:hypothetical protein